MRCKNEHDHSQRKVSVAQKNPTKPHGIRPFHCPDCPEVRKANKNSDNWVCVPIGEAENEGRGHCKVCF